MHYTLHQLQIFSKIVEKQSITKASEELHLTQPAVSIQLRNFQNQFPIPLTEVIGRKLYVTDFGKEIAIAAEKILQEVKDINYKTLAYQGQLSGVLKISVVSTGKYIMPYFLSDFIKQHKDVELVLDVTNKAQVIQSLEKNTVDFSLVSVLPDKLQIEKIELMENQLYLVGNNDEKFEKDIYDKSIFAKLPLIYREQGSGTRFTMEQFIEKNNLPVSKKMELTSNEAVKQAVIAGLGYSIMPIIGIRNELKTGRLQIIPIKDFPIKSNWHMIWLKDKKFSLVATTFLEYLKKEKSTIIKKRFDNF
ncbi:LysR family transcriptional regulator [Aquimarina sp. AD10]|uniref:LysR family transcriptional regulator n=1 Tax=Aquimarina aggregata TaxID=1642818 RepID=A0A163D0T9_9FLAO|nr:MULTISPECIES: LysR family transcriptional regulator [Aquimarina]AXT62676.1 LysR family transcriptional regulator [Aquimarina sp. AD10]KZS42910.1 LysR family transcriptional regulator [Aquimarina aggregata]RKM98329.1 LysR family transcriptional regulator [Aquimarina sp. AD10]